MPFDHIQQAGEPLPMWQWNDIGQQAPAGLTTGLELTKETSMDWTVSKRPLMFQSADGAILPVDGWKTTVRDDTDQVLGVVRNKYQVVQNDQCFSVLDKVAADKRIEFISTGALAGGSKVWALAKVNKATFEVFPGDVNQLYCLLINGHDSKISVRVMLIPFRLFCTNQFFMAMKEALGGFMVKHTGDVTKKLGQGEEALAYSISGFTHYGTFAAAAAKKSMAIAEQKQLIESVFPIGKDHKGAAREIATKGTQAKRDRAMHLSFNGRGQLDTLAAGTAWGLWNGITEAENFPIKKLGAERHITRLMQGNSSATIRKAYKLIRAQL